MQDGLLATESPEDTAADWSRQLKADSAHLAVVDFARSPALQSPDFSRRRRYRYKPDAFSLADEEELGDFWRNPLRRSDLPWPLGCNPARGREKAGMVLDGGAGDG